MLYIYNIVLSEFFSHELKLYGIVQHCTGVCV